MKKAIPAKLEPNRVREGYLVSNTGDRFGAFVIVGPNGANLRIIVAPPDEPINQGWEHVSVSIAHRCPNWQEMCLVKDLFWEEDECVIQFHPPKSEYVNHHPYCLHLWKHADIPTPPSELVGPKT
jgi:hypothetical protein